ncbi:MAG: hypothetical protein HY270_16910 [Deltaproteobacteria bacterium]|nr:hypothetical protein [Deltaproteobacteria bacterium]
MVRVQPEFGILAKPRLPEHRWIYIVAVLALLWGALAVNAWQYRLFLADDGLISLRYSQRLLDGKGLTWTDGERVEGYSNVLWVLACAGVGAFGIDLIVAARSLGLLSMAAAIAAFVYFSPPRSVRGLLPSVAGGLTFALAGCTGAWAVGGLEQALLAALLAWAMVLAVPLVDEDEPEAKRLLASGLLFGLLSLTRPDGVLFVVAISCAWIAALRFEWKAVRAVAWLLVIPALALALQLAFRLSYYGEWVPNTAFAKLTLSSGHLHSGAYYLMNAAHWHAGAAAAGLLGLIVGVCVAPLRRRAFVLFVPLVAWTLYVLFIGGEWFLPRRHVVPMVVLCALLAAQGAAWAVMRHRIVPLLAWVAAALVSVGLVWGQQNDPHLIRARQQIWVWNGEVLGRLLHDAFAQQQPLCAVDPAGGVPFFSRLPALDMLGLTDRYMAHHPPADFGSGAVAHELGDGRYVLDRAPDLILFCSPDGSLTPCFRSGKEMVADPRFAREYRPVLFRGTQPYQHDSVLYVRRTSPRIGVQTGERRLVVPGYLLSDGREALAMLDDEGRLGVLIREAIPLAFSDFELPEGEWQLAALNASGERQRIQMWSHRDQRFLESSEPASGTIDITIRAFGSPLHVRELVFERRS